MAGRLFSRIILASSSPRRIELLTQLGLKFETRSPDVDETPLRGEKPRAMVARLALGKAEAVDESLPPSKLSRLVIAADTIVVAPDGRRVLGKPRNRAEAASMLRVIAGRTHTVLTGYCLLSTRAAGRGRGEQQSIVRVVRSKVKIRKLSREDLNAYLATGESMDKAGAYAAQGHGAALIDAIQGSYTNVVGLPMAQLAFDLEAAFGVPLFGWRGKGGSR
jgi:septum formation protein